MKKNRMILLTVIVAAVLICAAAFALAGGSSRQETGESIAISVQNTEATDLVETEQESDVLAAEDLMILNDLLGLLQDQLGGGVCNDDGKAVFITDLADDMRIHGTKAGNLQGLEANVMQFLGGHTKIGLVLCKIADGKALCTNNHGFSSLIK